MLIILVSITIIILSSILGLIAELGQNDQRDYRDHVTWTQNGPVNGSGQTKRRYL